MKKREPILEEIIKHARSANINVVISDRTRYKCAMPYLICHSADQRLSILPQAKGDNAPLPIERVYNIDITGEFADDRSTIEVCTASGLATDEDGVIFEKAHRIVPSMGEKDMKIALDELLLKALEFIKEHSPTLEIEYKFLPHEGIDTSALIELVEEQATNVEDIKQCYLNTDKDRTARVRIIDNRLALQTIKMTGDVELEWQIPLPQALYLMRSYKEGEGIIAKRRYTIPWEAEGLKIEVDVFMGCLEGLILIEVEVPHKDYKFKTLPSWFGRDVSKSPKFKNAVMAFISNIQELQCD